MEQRISLITLGVKDLARSTKFFESLGWKRSVKEASGVAFFQCGSMAFGLFPHEELAKDAGVAVDGCGFENFSIAYNARSKEEVDRVLAEVQSLGAEIVKPAEDVFWGGYSGYFRDLDGHLWEVAWNPGFIIDKSGAVKLPD
ncbi:MAG: VOC family protein [Sneathiella sp.]|nr:VOC family protein [Sneathiella sp.]